MVSKRRNRSERPAAGHGGPPNGPAVPPRRRAARRVTRRQQDDGADPDRRRLVGYEADTDRWVDGVGGTGFVVLCYVGLLVLIWHDAPTTPAGGGDSWSSRIAGWDVGQRVAASAFVTGGAMLAAFAVLRLTGLIGPPRPPKE